YSPSCSGDRAAPDFSVQLSSSACPTEPRCVGPRSWRQRLGYPIFVAQAWGVPMGWDTAWDPSGASRSSFYEPGLPSVAPAPLRSRYRGCLLGGAIGDALGAPVEFLSLY